MSFGVKEGIHEGTKNERHGKERRAVKLHKQTKKNETNETVKHSTFPPTKLTEELVGRVSRLGNQLTKKHLSHKLCPLPALNPCYSNVLLSYYPPVSLS